MPVKKNGISIRLISDIEELDQYNDQWNAIVERSSKDPFLFFDFIKQSIKYVPKDWIPFVLIILKGKKIVGVAPLKIRIYLADYKLDFILAKWHSDFIFNEKYREICIKKTCEFLFTNLKCNNVHFVFPHNSPNLVLLGRYCKRNRIHMETYPEMGRRVISINSAWSEFLTSRTSNLGKKLRKLKRNLNKSGSWKVVCFKENEQAEIAKRVFAVEKKSWKESWRLQRGEEDDMGLKIIFNAISILSSKVENLGLRTWFLELNGKTIAYVMMIWYKETAFFVKTSYDNQYRKLSPGKITRILVFNQLFNENQIKYIDFLTDMLYMRAWTDTCLPRVGVVLAKGIVPKMLLIIRQKLISSIRSSHFLMQKIETDLSEGGFEKIFNAFLDRFV